LDDAIARARAFAETGADAVFVEAPQSNDEMTRIRAALPPSVRLVANMVEDGKTPPRTLAELGTAGFQIVLFPVAGLLASARALGTVFGTLAREGSTASCRGSMLRFDEMNTLVGLDERYRREREWLG